MRLRLLATVTKTIFNCDNDYFYLLLISELCNLPVVCIIGFIFEEGPIFTLVRMSLKNLGLLRLNFREQ